MGVFSPRSPPSRPLPRLSLLPLFPFLLLLSFSSLLPLFLSPFFSLAQVDEFFDDDFVRYEDRTYQPNINTIQFHLPALQMRIPVIILHVGQLFELSFV